MDKSDKKKLVLDIMMGEKYYKTLRLPITLEMIDGYEGDEPILKLEKIKEAVEEALPSLKYREYRICF